jgi:hypothetical protein
MMMADAQPMLTTTAATEAPANTHYSHYLVPCGIHFVKKLQKVKYRFCGDSSNIRTGPKVLLLMAAGPQFPAMLEIQSETQRVMTKFI